MVNIVVQVMMTMMIMMMTMMIMMMMIMMMTMMIMMMMIMTMIKINLQVSRIVGINTSNHTRLASRNKESKNSPRTNELEYNTVLCSLTTRSTELDALDQITTQDNTACSTRDNYHSG